MTTPMCILGHERNTVALRYMYELVRVAKTVAQVYLQMYRAVSTAVLRNDADARERDDERDEEDALHGV